MSCRQDAPFWHYPTRRWALLTAAMKMVQVWTALTLAMRGGAQLSLADHAAAIRTCDDFMRRFGSWYHGRFEAVIAETLVTRGGRGHS